MDHFSPPEDVLHLGDTPIEFTLAQRDAMCLSLGVPPPGALAVHILGGPNEGKGIFRCRVGVSRRSNTCEGLLESLPAR
jgi:hypothetical protein